MDTVWCVINEKGQARLDTVRKTKKSSINALFPPGWGDVSRTIWKKSEQEGFTCRKFSFDLLIEEKKK